MLSIILHDICLRLSNMCDIDRNSCILLFNAMSLYCILILVLILQ